MLKKRYHITSDKKTILFLTGGKGSLDPTEYIRSLTVSSEPLQIIVIAGDNTVLQEHLKQISFTNTTHEYRVLGWTDHIDEYMRISDYIITKPGGLTTSECIALKKQMILVSPIPGQEEANLTYFCTHNAAIYAQTPAEILSCIQKTWIVPTSMHHNASRIILETIKKEIS